MPNSLWGLWHGSPPIKLFVYVVMILLHNNLLAIYDVCAVDSL